MNTRIINLSMKNEELKASSFFMGFEGEHLVTTLKLTNDNFDNYKVFLKFELSNKEAFISDELILDNGYYNFKVPQSLLKEGNILIQVQIMDADGNLIKESGIAKLLCGKKIASDSTVNDKYIGLLEQAILEFRKAVEEMKKAGYITEQEARELIDLKMAEIPTIVENEVNNIINEKDIVTKDNVNQIVNELLVDVNKNIEDLQNNKQNVLTAGENITITLDLANNKTIISSKNTDDYTGLKNIPKINGHDLIGDQTSTELGLDVATELKGTEENITADEVINKIKKLENDKQQNLVSGENIKTINQQSILESGDLQVLKTDMSNISDSGIAKISNIAQNLINEAIGAIEPIADDILNLIG